MNLAIDIGNTRTKVGLFENGRLAAWESWEQWDVDRLSAWTTNQKVKNVILSTVREALPAGVESFLQRHLRFFFLDAATPLPFENRYRTPQTLGRDRMAAVAGALDLFPQQDCLIIDAGTCITYDVLEQGGIYRGGNISPGVRMRMRAMHDFTARLPQVEPGPAGSWIGDSTEAALRNGAQWGAVLEMEGFISLAKAGKVQINVILTGGDADFFAKKLKSQIFVNHHLVLLGLNKILNYNVERLE